MTTAGADAACVLVLAEGADARGLRVPIMCKQIEKFGMRPIVYCNGGSVVDTSPAPVVTHIVLCSHRMGEGNALARCHALLKASGLACACVTRAPIVHSDWTSDINKCCHDGARFERCLLARLGDDSTPPAPKRPKLEANRAEQTIPDMSSDLTGLPATALPNDELAQPLALLGAMYAARGHAGDEHRKKTYSRAASFLRSCGQPIESMGDFDALLLADRESGRQELGLGKQCRESIEEMLNAKAAGLTARAGLSRLNSLLNDERTVTSVSFLRIHGACARATARGRREYPHRLAHCSCPRLPATAVAACASLTGVGLRQAKEWYDCGLRTYEDLRAADYKLSDVQKIGLHHVHDFARPVPRAEITKCAALVRDELEGIVGSAQVHFCEPVGSYRRGKKSSHDVDILIALEEATSREGTLGELVERLATSGFVTDVLAQPGGGARRRAGASVGSSRVQDDEVSSTDEHQSFMGVCRLPEPAALHRRIDIKICARAQLPFALLHFTGSEHFNIAMRHHAKRHNWSLSEHGLQPAWYEHGNRGAKITNTIAAASIPCTTERDIFANLRLQWREPYERECTITPLDGRVGGELDDGAQARSLITQDMDDGADGSLCFEGDWSAVHSVIQQAAHGLAHTAAEQYYGV